MDILGLQREVPQDLAGSEGHRVRVLPLAGGQSSVISASRITAASLPPNVEENTVMPAKLYSGGASFISRCIVPVRSRSVRSATKEAPDAGRHRIGTCTLYAPYASRRQDRRARLAPVSA